MLLTPPCPGRPAVRRRGFGGAVLLLPALTVVLGLHVAVPVFTLTQLASNGARVRPDRGEVRWVLAGGRGRAAHRPFFLVGVGVGRQTFGRSTQ